ncbi:uncharacterized protein LOC131847101 [Achroia grisella]|uniref:uncharacterized protein LOC131847101 n=1 Tax=Achroia grisella TaxID=688607 RepID=UPI0027D2D559|nr:uncharacterized protein LOC131847101 [Achroia grisella]
MGAGQIGGIATMLDIDFKNAAGFIGVQADLTEAQYIVHFLSHAMMFCVGALIEAHVVLTPASCVFGERYKFDVIGGTHNFLEFAGVNRLVHHLCIHRGYNHTRRWIECSPDNVALLVLNQQFSFHKRELGSDFVINRVRYGTSAPKDDHRIGDSSCRYYGWGSRRNGYLIPLLIHLRRVDVILARSENCPQIWNYNNKYLCVQQPPCKSEKFGALCPDDLGTIIVCSGFVQGMMTSRLVDRPCGVGFLDLSKYNKFLTCGVDDSRDVIDHDDFMTFDFTTNPPTPSLIVPPVLLEENITSDR